MIGSQGARQGSTRPARVIGLRLEHGVPVCDVTDAWGNTFLSCRFLGEGGGPLSFDYVPPVPHSDPEATPEDSDGSEVHVSRTDGLRPHVTSHGTQIHPRAASRFEVLSEPGDGDEYSDKNGLLDMVRENNGARVLVSEFGLVVLDTKSSGQPVYVQLSAGSYLRISQDGTATERLLLAGPTRQYMDELASKINDLETKLVTLQNLVKTAASATPGAPVEVGFLAFSKAIGGGLQALTPDPKGQTQDDMVASAVRVSAQSLADE